MSAAEKTVPRGAKILLTISFGVFAALHAFLAPLHLGAEEWHLHSLNHHLRGSISSATLGIVGIVLSFTALQTRWGFLVVSLIFLASSGGFWFAYATLEFGLEPERTPALVIAIVHTVAGALGLAWVGRSQARS